MLLHTNYLMRIQVHGYLCPRLEENFNGFYRKHFFEKSLDIFEKFCSECNFYILFVTKNYLYQRSEKPFTQNCVHVHKKYVIYDIVKLVLSFFVSFQV